MRPDDFITLVLENPVNRAILARLPALELPDAWLVSGSLFQTAWNCMTGRPVDHGIKDYDLFYFDPDESWRAEDAVIRRCAEAFRDLPAAIEVRNQARVHRWYAAKFGAPYPPVVRATDAIDRFLTSACMVGLAPRAGRLELYAPRGLDDLAAMMVRPNRSENFQQARFEEKTARWKACWPEITVLTFDEVPSHPLGDPLTAAAD